MLEIAERAKVEMSIVMILNGSYAMTDCAEGIPWRVQALFLLLPCRIPCKNHLPYRKLQEFLELAKNLVFGNHRLPFL